MGRAERKRLSRLKGEVFRFQANPTPGISKGNSRMITIGGRFGSWVMVVMDAQLSGPWAVVYYPRAQADRPETLADTRDICVPWTIAPTPDEAPKISELNFWEEQIVKNN